MFLRLFPLALACATLVAPARAAERPLAVDLAQSRIEVAVHATADSFTGHLNAYEPALAADEAGRIVAARVAFHFRDIATGKAKRDEAMHGWQETKKFPDGQFELIALEAEPAPATGQRARGRLTLHGVTRELSFPISILREGSLYVFDGDAPVDTREFGLPIIRMFAVLKVSPVVHVRFHLQARNQP